jgi:hypothetical protein
VTVTNPVPTPDSVPMSIDDRLAVIESQITWITNTLHVTANHVLTIGKNFDMIIQGLMASPFGAQIRKMQGGNNG